MNYDNYLFRFGGFIRNGVRTAYVVYTIEMIDKSGAIEFVLVPLVAITYPD